MPAARILKWAFGVLLALTLPVLTLLAVTDWNWLRAPLERQITKSTGRVLTLDGELTIEFGWPLTHIRVGGLSFANPPWAREKQMLTSDELALALDVPQLFRGNIRIHDLRLSRPVVFLEQSADGRKNWLLDREQRDDDARIEIRRLTLDRGRIGYEDPRQRTHIRAEISTRPGADNAAAGGVVFSAQGRYRDLALKAQGSGGSILALRDESLPYSLKLDALLGRTHVDFDGSVTGLTQLSAIDTRLAVRGDSLAQLYPVLGIALPETRAYRFAGRLLHSAGIWRYEKFTGRVGASDIAGSVRVDVGSKRPALRAELLSQSLDLADLGPPIGASGTPSAVRERVLPELPFRAERWGSVDADVMLDARSLRRAEALPIDNLVVRLQLRDAVLTLDPLRFGVAGGSLEGRIALDGRQNPIRAQAQGQASRILLSKLFPTLDRKPARIGRIDGRFELAGSGQSVAQMLGSANGHLAFVMNGGEISRLMLKMIGLHLWEMLQLKLTGDEVSTIRCGIADFGVKDGVMASKTLLLDTDVTTIDATGHIDLNRERLDLVLTQRTKVTSPVALRSPIYVRGSFAAPHVAVDTGQVAARGLGALALGLINPLAALLPLVEAGPGMDSDCGALIRAAQVPQPGKARNNPAAVSAPP